MFFVAAEGMEVVREAAGTEVGEKNFPIGNAGR